jgi:pyridoxine 5-phosphate synthase
MKVKLNINIDHIATLRQARLGEFPNPIDSISIIKKAKADGVVMHLREDRRHIQTKDLISYKRKFNFHLNLEIAPTLDMVRIANKIMPQVVTLVPEKRMELTTEGGLNLKKNYAHLEKIIGKLSSKIKVMLFIDPIKIQIDSARELGVDGVEINTGKYSENYKKKDNKEYLRIKKAAIYSTELKLYTAAGHGLNEKNLKKLIKIKELREYNIGHSIISNSIFYGLNESITRIQDIINCHD